MRLGCAVEEATVPGWLLVKANGPGPGFWLKKWSRAWLLVEEMEQSLASGSRSDALLCSDQKPVPGSGWFRAQKVDFGFCHRKIVESAVTRSRYLGSEPR